MRVFMVTSHLFGSGGIPITNQLLMGMLHDEWPNENHLVFSLNDAPRTVAERASVALPIRAFDGNRGWFALAVFRQVLLDQFDLVLFTHVNLSPLGFVPSLLSRRSRYVVIAHGIEVWERLSVLRRLALRRAMMVVAVSDYTRQRLFVANKNDLNRVRVVHWCLPPWRATEEPGPAEAISIPARNGPMLLSVGQVNFWRETKGHDKVILALPKIKVEVPNVYYVVVGSGNDVTRLRDLAASCGVADDVMFVGEVSDVILRDYYRLCDLFVLPSMKEGFGLVFLEAMWHRKPVVAGNIDATPEVVPSGVAGLLVDPTDVDSIASAVTLLLRDPVRRADMGEAGHRLVASRFSYTVFQRDLRQVLEEAIA